MTDYPRTVLLAFGLFLLLVLGLAAAWRAFLKHRAAIVRSIQRQAQRVASSPRIRALHARYPRASAFITARFARGEYLGLHLTVGLAISIVALWLFAAVTEDVVQREPLTDFDSSLVRWLHAHATSHGYAVFRMLTLVGAPLTLTILAAGMMLLLATRRQWVLLGAWLVTLSGGALLAALLKLAIKRPRPPYAGSFLMHFSWSFPSGHAMESLVAYGMLAYLICVLWVHARRAQIAVAVSLGLLVAAIGLSRLYLGVHYFSDVVGGYAAGILWLSVCISGVEVIRGWRSGASAIAP